MSTERQGAGITSVAKALVENVGWDWNGRALTFELDGQWSTEEYSATPELLRTILPRAVELAQDRGMDDADLESVKSYLNDLIDAAESTHDLGEIVERRTRVVDTTTMFTGAGKRTRHEALIRLAADWTDPRGQFPVERKAGEEVWIETAAPADRV